MRAAPESEDDGAWLASCREALAAGELRRVRAILRQQVGWTASAAQLVTPARRRALALLAQVCASLGQTEEGARLLAQARAPGARGAQSCDWWRARVELDWAYGDPRALARSTNSLFAMAPSRRDPEPWMCAVHQAGLALALLGDPEGARRCIGALESSAPAILGRSTAIAELRGELAWREALSRWVTAIVRRHPTADSWRPPEAALECAQRANQHFNAGLATMPPDAPAWQRRVAAGADKSRLLRDGDRMTLERLERWDERVRAEAALGEVALARVALGAAYLAAARYLRAARIFATAGADGQALRGLELHLAACAFEGNGEHRAALACLKRLCLEEAMVRAAPAEPFRVSAAGSASGTARRAALLVEQAYILAIEQPQATRNVAQLAHALGVSRRTLEYAFMRSCRTTPKRAVTALRLDEASRRLAAPVQAGQASLESIAQGCGFSSYQSFARAIRGTYALAPSAWRPRS